MEHQVLVEDRNGPDQAAGAVEQFEGQQVGVARARDEQGSPRHQSLRDGRGSGVKGVCLRGEHEIQLLPEDAKVSFRTLHDARSMEHSSTRATPISKA